MDRGELDGALVHEGELWLAAPLAPTSFPWVGRWFDGLVLLEEPVIEGARPSLAGYVWSIQQQRWPDRAAFVLESERLPGYDVEVARPLEGSWLTGTDTEPPWVWRFTRG